MTLTVAVVHEVRQLDVAETHTLTVADDILEIRIYSRDGVATILAEVLPKT